MADAYTNDLRLREQEVGANSGAWGGYLNTTIGNLAESWSYGAEALANSATQTLTLADGTSDELRSFYLKLTGTLSQATTVTIAPNTISKSWMIENATTGGYAVTLSQGSGANVTVANGNVKMVATDGAGAGAVVYDLFTDLELGALTQDGGAVFNEDSADVDFRVESNGDAHRLFIDGGNDRLLIGTTASVAMSGITPSNFLEGTDYATSTLGMAINANGALNAPLLMVGKSRGTSLGSNTIVQDGDRLFSLRVHGSDGTNQEQAALIEAYVDGTPGANEIPGRLSFWTTNDGSQYATEKMRINNAGNVTISDGNLIVASGHGIDFSATGDVTGSASEVLNDYEEGEYNPTVTGSTGGSYGLSAGSDTLAYTKVGRVVHVQGYVAVDSESSPSGALLISLPIAAATLTEDADYGWGTLMLANRGSTLTHNLYAFIQAGSGFYIYKIADDGTAGYVDTDDVDTNYQIGVGFSYIA